MRFYHFTSLGHLPVILATGGLWRGELPYGDGANWHRATWLTTDPDPRGHGLDGSSVDKREVRIVLVFPRGDTRAVPWRKEAARTLHPDCIEQLVRTGGGRRKAETWYVCRSQIPPQEFRAIEIRGLDGGYAPATPEQIAAAVPHEGLREDVDEEFAEIRGRRVA